jgi:hypothetical protein
MWIFGTRRMAEKAVLLDDFEVVPMLQQMELDRDFLIAVVRFADSQRTLCTANDVRGFDLITVYDKAARGLRETFCGPRWEKDETDNQAGIKNPHLKIRIIPCILTNMREIQISSQLIALKRAKPHGQKPGATGLAGFLAYQFRS